MIFGSVYKTFFFTTQQYIDGIVDITLKLSNECRIRMYGVQIKCVITSFIQLQPTYEVFRVFELQTKKPCLSQTYSSAY